MSNKFRMYYIKQIVPDPPEPTIPVVLMPDGKYWMKEDMAIDDGLGGILIKDNVTSNGINFGTVYYYTHDAAMRIAANTPGYHLPTPQEYYTLFNSIDGITGTTSTKLRSIDGWNSGSEGTDDYGFNVLPTGNTTGGNIEWLGSLSNYWCYDEAPSGSRYNCVRIWTDSIDITDEVSSDIYSFCFRIRLMRDY